MRLPTTKIGLLLETLLFLIIIIFSVKTAKAQIPPPYVPCNQVRSPEFHSLRPYQASPCNQEATELALYCDSSFVLPDTFVIDKTFSNPPTSWVYSYLGNPISPVRPEDSFNQPACRFCVGNFCAVSLGTACVADLNQCQTNTDCFNSCRNNLDGTETCTFLVNRERDVAIDLSGAEFPIMGNTQDVINSQNLWGNSLPFDVFDVSEPLDAYDPTKVNEYVSWYLNGIINRAEYKTLDPDDPNDFLKITDFSGPIRKLLSFENQITQRVSQINEANEGDVRHNQVVGCDNLTGNPTECYPQRAGVRERRLRDWLPNNLPPLREAFDNFSDYWGAYTDWRNGNPRFIGNLFDYIPFSSTEDRKGLDEAVFQSIQPAQPYVRIVSATLTQTPADLFFAHIEETAGLANILQKTFAFRGAALDGPPANIAPPANAYCDLVEVRSNPGDDLFAGEIRVHLEYEAQIDCSFLIPYLWPNPAEGVPPGNVCENLAGGTCQYIPENYQCDYVYGPVDCPPDPLNPEVIYCAVNCRPLSNTAACADLGKQCYPSTWGSCTGVTENVFVCPAGVDCTAVICQAGSFCDGDGCLPGSFCANNYCPPGYDCYDNPCSGSDVCANGRVQPITEPNLTQQCPVTVNVNLGTVTHTPKADELWSRFVSGPAGIFRRVFPKIEPGAPIEALWDIPASTPVTFTAPGLVYVGIPGSGRTQPELYFPHIGGIHQYFLKCIQRALRPQGFGEPCISGSPGTNAPTDSTCPNVPDSAIPARWIGPAGSGIKDHFIWAADLWCGGVGENMAEECYNYVVQQSLAAGVNPAFSLSIWLHESAASNYTCSGAGAQDFGINDPSIAMNLVLQLQRFLTLPYSSTYLYCRTQAQSRGLDPMFGFLDRFRDGNCDFVQNGSNAGWSFYQNMMSFAWPLVTEPIRNCVTGWFGILWPTDFACP